MEEVSTMSAKRLQYKRHAMHMKCSSCLLIAPTPFTRSWSRYPQYGDGAWNHDWWWWCEQMYSYSVYWVNFPFLFSAKKEKKKRFSVVSTWPSFTSISSKSLSDLPYFISTTKTMQGSSTMQEQSQLPSSQAFLMDQSCGRQYG